MAHDNSPLCLRDYNLKYGVKCYECQRYIGGKVLQAGNYKFHPTCARCTRCGMNFGDGQEMFIQGLTFSLFNTHSLSFRQRHLALPLRQFNNGKSGCKPLFSKRNGEKILLGNRENILRSKHVHFVDTFVLLKNPTFINPLKMTLFIHQKF